jgi:transposase InsO family protein
MYLATVIDLFSGRLIGWSIADHHRAELVRDSLAAAVAVRGGDVAGVIFHSDRGSGIHLPPGRRPLRRSGHTQKYGSSGLAF